MCRARAARGRRSGAFSGGSIGGGGVAGGFGQALFHLLGTDGAASNNRQDMFGEIRSAALLAKGVTGDPTVASARTALEMATLRAAKAMGRGDDLGSLEVGKLADVVAVSLDSVECQPVYNAAAQLVYVAGREHVSHVWVGGRPLLRDRQLTSIDVPALLAEVRDVVGRMKAG